MKNRILASLLVLCMVLALGLTACSNTAATTTTAAETTTAAAEETTTAAAEEETTAAEGEEETTAAEGEKAPATWENLSWEKDTSPVTFSCYLNYDWYAVDTWKGEVPDEITRLTGVSLEATKGSDPAVLMTHLAAQELNDIIFTDNNVVQFHDEEVLYAWNKLIPEYCPEFWDLVDPLEKINNMAADGNTYTFKTHYKDDADYNDDHAIGNFTNASIAYREDITSKLGIAAPKTVEEFEAMLYKVKENAADVGITMVFNMHPSWSEILSYWMGCQQANMWDAEKKSITMANQDTKWLEYYKLLNKWYRDGILTQDYLGVRPEDFFARNKSGQVFCYSYNWGLPGDVNGGWRDTDFGGKFDDLSKPYMRLIEGSLTYKGEDNLPKVSSDYGTGWSSCFISTNCENPGRAICFMEFLKSPFGDKLTQWGIEGVHYELVDGLPKNLESFMNRPAEERGSDYTGIGPWYLQGSDRMEGIKSYAGAAVNAKDEWTKEDGMQGIRDRTVKKAACYANKNPAMSFARIEADDEEMAANAKINDQWAKSKALMITAESEAAVEQLYAEYKQYCKDAGVDAVQAKMTERYLEYLPVYQEAGYFTDIKVD